MFKGDDYGLRARHHATVIMGYEDLVLVRGQGLGLWATSSYEYTDGIINPSGSSAVAMNVSASPIDFKNTLLLFFFLYVSNPSAK